MGSTLPEVDQWLTAADQRQLLAGKPSFLENADILDPIRRQVRDWHNSEASVPWLCAVLDFLSEAKGKWEEWNRAGRLSNPRWGHSRVGLTRALKSWADENNKARGNDPAWSVFTQEHQVLCWGFLGDTYYQQWRVCKKPEKTARCLLQENLLQIAQGSGDPQYSLEDRILDLYQSMWVSWEADWRKRQAAKGACWLITLDRKTLPVYPSGTCWSNNDIETCLEGVGYHLGRFATPQGQYTYYVLRGIHLQNLTASAVVGHVVAGPVLVIPDWAGGDPAQSPA